MRRSRRVAALAIISAAALATAACSSSGSSAAGSISSTSAASTSAAASSAAATSAESSSAATGSPGGSGTAGGSGSGSSSAAGSGSGSASSSSAAPTSVDFTSLSAAYASAGDSVGIFKTVGDGVVDDATKLGIKIKRYDNNLDGPTALNNAQLIVQTKPDVAIDWNTVVGVGAAVGQQFTKAHIPCLAVNQQIPGCAWYNLSNKELGLDAANIILPVAKSRGWTGAEHHRGHGHRRRERHGGQRRAPVLLRPDREDAARVREGHARTDHAHRPPRSEGRTGSRSTARARSTARSRPCRTQSAPSPRPTTSCSTAATTTATLGAYRSLKQGGFGDRILTGGLGADPDGLNALRTDPNWLSEGALFIQQWGPYVLSEAVAITQGVTPPPLTSAPQVTLTKDTIDTYYNADNSVKLLPPLVDNNKYLADYGILQQFAKISGLNA